MTSGSDDALLTTGKGRGASDAPPRSWRRFAERVDADELATIVGLCSLAVVVRVLWLTPVEIWGDAGLKWHFSRQLAYANDFRHAEWSHHMARLGINWPVYLLQRAFGTAPKLYYVAPVGSYVLQVLLVYLVGKRVSGRVAGCLGALLAIFFTGMIRSSSQLLPDGIAATVLMLACYLLLRYYEASGAARLRWLVGAGLAFGWAYTIKESSLLLLPGGVLCVLLARRSFKEAALFGAVVVAFIGLETAWFRAFTPYSSRFAIVGAAPEYDPIHFSQLFDRFIKLEPSWQVLLWPWVAAALWLRSQKEWRFQLTVILPATFLFFLTFMVRHVDPLIPWNGNKSRYLAVVAPFMILGVAVFMAETARYLWRRFPSERLASLASPLRRDPGTFVLCLCLLLGAIVWRSEGKHRYRALKSLAHQAKVLNDAYRRNLPIIDRTGFARGLKTTYEVHLDDALLASARDARPGTLPDVNDAVKVTKIGRQQLHYLLQDPSAYSHAALADAVKSRCALTVVTRGSTVSLSPDYELPATCAAPR